jgi:hypothetical protein
MLHPQFRGHTPLTLFVYPTCACLTQRLPQLAAVENDTERLFDNWITNGRSALAYVQARGGINVVLTNAPLKGTLAKLVLFGMVPQPTLATAQQPTLPPAHDLVLRS